MDALSKFFLSAHLAVHDEATGQPGEVSVICLQFLVIDVEENLLRLLIIAHSRLGLAIIKVESVLAVEVRLYRIEIEQDIVKLFEQKEAGSHTLPEEERF